MYTVCSGKTYLNKHLSLKTAENFETLFIQLEEKATLNCQSIATIQGKNVQ